METTNKKVISKWILFLGISLWILGTILNYIVQLSNDNLAQSPLLEYLYSSLNIFPYKGALLIMMLFVTLFIPIMEELSYRVWTKEKTWAYILSLFLGTMYVYMVSQKVILSIFTAIILFGCFFLVKNYKLKMWLSIIITSLIFTLLHISGISSGISMISVLITIFGLSLVLCYIGIRYGFVYCILLHCVNNFIGFIPLMPLKQAPDMVWENENYQVYVSEKPLWEQSEVICCNNTSLFFKGLKTEIAADIFPFSNDKIYQHTFTNFHQYYVTVNSKNHLPINREDLFDDYVEKMNLQLDTTIHSAWMFDVKNDADLCREKENTYPFFLENEVVLLRKAFKLPLKMKQENFKDSAIYLGKDDFVLHPFQIETTIEKYKSYGIYIYEDTTQQISVIRIRE